MKKILTSVLILTLIFTLFSVCAGAETIGSGTGSASHDVTASYEEGSSAPTVYSVDITWGNMAFTYTDAKEGTWNPETHSYDGAAEASWQANAADGDKITFTNHSNAGVTASLTYEASTGFDGITGTFDTASVELKTAVGTTVANAPEKTVTLTLSGALGSNTTAGTKIGTVKVTLR